MSIIKTHIGDKRKAIVQTATKLFGERGFEDSSTRDIALAADVNIALIAYYFKSKEGLFDAIVEERMPMFGARLSEIRQSHLSATEKITLIFDEYCDKIMSNPDFSRMVYRQITYSQRSPSTQKILVEMRKNRNVILEIFEEGKLNGEFDPGVDYKLLLITFFSTISTMVKSPIWVASGMDLKSEEEVFSKDFIQKIKNFIREFIFRFALLNTDLNSEMVLK